MSRRTRLLDIDFQIDVEHRDSHYLSQNAADTRITSAKRISQHLSGPRTSRPVPSNVVSDYACRLNRSMQHSSTLLIRLCFSKRPDPLDCTQLNLDRRCFL